MNWIKIKSRKIGTIQLLLFNVLFRNPNSPATVEDLIKTRNDAKRNKMVVWEPFDSQRRYLNLGEN